jgi:hypothetical protein
VAGTLVAGTLVSAGALSTPGWQAVSSAPMSMQISRLRVLFMVIPPYQLLGRTAYSSKNAEIYIISSHFLTLCAAGHLKYNSATKSQVGKYTPCRKTHFLIPAPW